MGIVSSVNSVNVSSIIQFLRDSGNDTYKIEAKDASRGMPSDIDKTLSAFGNMPEGGLILLGIAENDGAFEVTGVWNAKEAHDALSSKAREKITPPLQLGAVETAQVEGKEVVACVIPPQPGDFKPFRVEQYGRSYTRSADGDYELSPREEQFLTGTGQQPVHDRAPVAGAHVDRDVDKDLLQQYLDAQCASSPRLARTGRDEQLIRTNVVVDEHGTPTTAAIYALGIHPQQFFPHLAIKVSADVPQDNDLFSDVRMINSKQFTGPVPDLLEQSFDWVKAQINTGISFRGGHGVDVPEFPDVAVRELIANCLVHRDLSPASFGMYSQVVKRGNKLIFINPGGLWGLTARELGNTGPRAKNPVLYDMCSAIQTSRGHRVIEAKATGIPAVRAALKDALLPEPFFKDEVVQFRALLSSSTFLGDKALAWLATLPGNQVLSAAQKHALVLMRQGEQLTNSSYRKQFPMDSVDARLELQQLVEYGLVTVQGQGRSTKYMLHRALTDQTPATPAHRDDSEGNGTATTLEPSIREGHEQGRNQDKAATGLSRAYIAMEEKRQRIVDVLRRAGKALSRESIQEQTGLTVGQLAPALKLLLAEDQIEQTAEASTSRMQRYKLKE